MAYYYHTIHSSLIITLSPPPLNAIQHDTTIQRYYSLTTSHQGVNDSDALDLCRRRKKKKKRRRRRKRPPHGLISQR